MAKLLKPLVAGRILRVASGLVCFYFVIELLDPSDLGLIIASVALGLLGLSLIVGGLLANPGCEVTALPNLFLQKKTHFF